MIAPEQSRAYDRNGFLLLPGWFDQQEVDALRSEIPEILAVESAGRTKEKSDEHVRIFYGVHKIGSLFGELVRHPRVLPLVRQIIGEPVYVHQSKLNMKAAFEGSAFDWHQDFAFWHHRDGMPRPNVVNVIVFLDDVDLFNAPIYLVPGTHRLGLVNGSAVTLSKEQVRDLVAQHGLEAAIGTRGSVLIFGGMIVHASPPNISPYNRALALITYNAVSNSLNEGTDGSHEHLAERHIEPLIVADNDDVLRRPSRRYMSRLEDFRLANMDAVP